MIIGQGGTTDKAYLPLATREKNPIPNEQRRELSPARLKTIDELWKRERPDAILRSSTAVYNCMGLVFASRRTWVDTSYLEMIFDEEKMSSECKTPIKSPVEILIPLFIASYIPRSFSEIK